MQRDAAGCGRESSDSPDNVRREILGLAPEFIRLAELLRENNLKALDSISLIQPQLREKSLCEAIRQLDVE